MLPKEPGVCHGLSKPMPGKAETLRILSAGAASGSQPALAELRTRQTRSSHQPRSWASRAASSLRCPQQSGRIQLEERRRPPVDANTQHLWSSRTVFAKLFLNQLRQLIAQREDEGSTPMALLQNTWRLLNSPPCHIKRLTAESLREYCPLCDFGASEARTAVPMVPAKPKELQQAVRRPCR